MLMSIASEVLIHIEIASGPDIILALLLSNLFGTSVIAIFYYDQGEPLTLIVIFSA